jgi:serine/threonine-protein kinase HipA
MEVGPAGRWANAENLVSEAPRFLLEPAEARAIVDTMEKQVRSSWRRVARKCGVSERDCEQIAGAFAYPGFRLPLT